MSGSDTGGILRGICTPIVSNDPTNTTSGSDAHKGWKSSALQVLDSVGAPASQSRLAVRNHIEAYVAKSRDGNRQEICAALIYKSRPDPNLLLPQTKCTELEPHSGPITATRFSPFHRKMLLTSGMDGAIKIFDVHQARPVHIFYPPTFRGTISKCSVSDIDWSRARPLVFAVAPEDKDCGVFVYDLVANRHGPTLTIPFMDASAPGTIVRNQVEQNSVTVDEGNTLSTGTSDKITRVRFNPVQRGLLVVGTASGRINIFALPLRFSMFPKPSEIAMMHKLMNGRG